MDAELLRGIPGGHELLEWFGGRMPSFHDGEVLGLSLEREGASGALRVHGFEMTSEVDSRGCFICTRHAVVRFELRGITALELDGFNHQNALMGLALSGTEGEFRLEIEPAYGLGGMIQAATIAISIEPGLPAGSQYLDLARPSISEPGPGNSPT